MEKVVFSLCCLPLCFQKSKKAKVELRIISRGKWAPVKLLAIVALPQEARWLREEDDTAKRFQ